MRSLTLPLWEADVDLAREAAAWLESFYPGTGVRVRAESVHLTTEKEASTSSLELAWAAALHNEWLHVANARARQELLEALTR